MSAASPLSADVEAMARLARALSFVCGPDHPATLAVQKAASSGTVEDIKKARGLFVQLKPGHQRAALAMIAT